MVSIEESVKKSGKLNLKPPYFTLPCGDCRDFGEGEILIEGIPDFMAFSSIKLLI